MSILRYSPLILGATIVAIAWAFSNNEAKQEVEPSPIVSKCDSLQSVNNELKFEIELLQDRVSKYETGLEFLKDKDIRAYRFVMNAGNLEFNDRL